MSSSLETVQLTATVIGGVAPYTYQWDFGDGSSPATGNPVTHSYTQVGTFTITATVMDSLGVQLSGTAQVVVAGTLITLQLLNNGVPVPNAPVSLAGNVYGAVYTNPPILLPLNVSGVTDANGKFTFYIQQDTPGSYQGITLYSAYAVTVVSPVPVTQEVLQPLTAAQKLLIARALAKNPDIDPDTIAPPTYAPITYPAGTTFMGSLDPLTLSTWVIDLATSNLG